MENRKMKCEEKWRTSEMENCKILFDVDVPNMRLSPFIVFQMPKAWKCGLSTIGCLVFLKRLKLKIKENWKIVLTYLNGNHIL